jgi:hypothetical protein
MIHPLLKPLDRKVQVGDHLLWLNDPCLAVVETITGGVCTGRSYTPKNSWEWRQEVSSFRTRYYWFTHPDPDVVWAAYTAAALVK